MTQPDDPGVTPPLKAEHQWLIRNFGRHCRPEDKVLDDRARGFTVIDRWKRTMAEPIIDVNE